MKKTLTVALTLIVCAVLFLTREKPPAFRTASVQVRSLCEKIETVGTVVPLETYALMPSVAGRITRVMVQEGQQVGAGQAVAEVELLPENAAAYLSTLQNAQLSAQEVQERMHEICTVTAPQAGKITGLSAYVGQQTAPGNVLGCVAADALAVSAYVPENLREDIFIGQSVRLRRGERTLDAYISRITPAQEAAGQYLVRIEPAENTRILQPGMRVDAEIVTEECTSPSIPLQALQPDGTVICRTQGGTAAVCVETGLCTEMYAQLLSGPPVGTEVVVGVAE